LLKWTGAYSINSSYNLKMFFKCAVIPTKNDVGVVNHVRKIFSVSTLYVGRIEDALKGTVT